MIPETILITLSLDTTCVQPVHGLCYSADTGQLVGLCCSGSYCFPVSDSEDYFFQQIMDLGSNCNQTVSHIYLCVLICFVILIFVKEHRGICKTGSFCIESLCTDRAQTTSTTTTGMLAILQIILNPFPSNSNLLCCRKNYTNEYEIIIVNIFSFCREQWSGPMA